MPKIQPPTIHLDAAIEQLHQAADAIDAAGTHIKLAVSELQQHNATGKPDDGTQRDAGDDSAEGD